MTEWLVVNGARIEKAYFEENVAEAKTYAWEVARPQPEKGHVHCMVCGVTISADEDDRTALAYRSRGGWLCDHCYTNYVRNVD